MNGRLGAALDLLASRRLAASSIGLVRAGFGFVALMLYASHYGQRSYMWGPDGVWPWQFFVEQLDQHGTFSLLALSRSPTWFEIVFHAAMLVSALVMIGWGGRGILLLHWVLLWSLAQRNPMLLDGGDNLAHIVVLMLLLTRCFDTFRLFPARGRSVLSQHWGATLLHNVGVLAVGAQISLVYVTSGLYKVQGQLWQDGTALYYVLRVPEFMWPGVSEHVFTNAYLVTVGSYAATLLLTLFPVAILVDWLRGPVTVMMIGFHLSIALLMGLTGFALTMIACDMVFLDQWVRSAHRAVADRTWGRRRTPVPSPVAGEPAMMEGV